MCADVCSFMMFQTFTKLAHAADRAKQGAVYILHYKLVKVLFDQIWYQFFPFIAASVAHVCTL